MPNSPEHWCQNPKPNISSLNPEVFGKEVGTSGRISVRWYGQDCWVFGCCLGEWRDRAIRLEEWAFSDRREEGLIFQGNSFQNIWWLWGQGSTQRRQLGQACVLLAETPPVLGATLGQEDWGAEGAESWAPGSRAPSRGFRGAEISVPRESISFLSHIHLSSALRLWESHLKSRHFTAMNHNMDHSTCPESSPPPFPQLMWGPQEITDILHKLQSITPKIPPSSALWHPGGSTSTFLAYSSRHLISEHLGSTYEGPVIFLQGLPD